MINKHIILLIALLFNTGFAFAQPKWNSPQEALDWLNTKIAGSRCGVMQYNQKATVDFSRSTAFDLSIDIEQNGIINSTTRYTFYPENINVEELAPEVKGMLIYLTISTQNNLKLIKEIEQGSGQSFTNNFRIYFDDLQVARDAAEAIKYIKQNVIPVSPSFASKEEGYNWLQNNVGAAKFGTIAIEQSIKIQTDQNNKFALSTTETGSKTIKKEYEFYLTDFKEENVLVNTTNSRLSITLTSNGDIKPVKYFLNGAQQNYTNKIEIFTDDAQKAIQIRNVFIYLITGKFDNIQQYTSQNLGDKIVGLFEKKESASTTSSGINTEMTWAGIDFSKTKCVGEFSQGFGVAPASPDDIKNIYYPSWNMLVISEADKYDVKQMMGNPNTKIDIESMQKHNANTIKENIMGYSNPNYSAIDIQNFVQEYSISGKGYGICFIVECLNKAENKAIIDFVLFDLTTKKVLVIEKIETKPSGMGIRNYWAGAIAEAINHSKRNWAKVWRPKYGL